MHLIPDIVTAAKIENSSKGRLAGRYNLHTNNNAIGFQNSTFFRRRVSDNMRGNYCDQASILKNHTIDDFS